MPKNNPVDETRRARRGSVQIPLLGSAVSYPRRAITGPVTLPFASWSGKLNPTLQADHEPLARAMTSPTTLAWADENGISQKLPISSPCLVLPGVGCSHVHEHPP